MSGELNPLLASGRIQLGLRRGVAPLRIAVILNLALGLLLVGTHLFYRAVFWQTMVILLLIPIAIAAFSTWRRWPSPLATAAWLDRRLDAQGMFSTHQEFVSERRGAGTSAALAAFESWTQLSLPRIRERLADLPEVGAARLAALLLLGALLAVAPAWLPGKSEVGATKMQPRAQASLLSDPDEPSPRVLSALRKNLDANSLPVERPLANTTTRVAGAPVSPDTDESNATPAAGAASSSAQGSSAGSNAASASTSNAILGRADLQARFRSIGRTPSATAGGAPTGAALQLGASTPARQMAAFDRETQTLAQHAAPAAQNADAVAVHAAPADNAFTQQFLRLRDNK